MSHPRTMAVVACVPAREGGRVQATRQKPAPAAEVWIEAAQALAIERVR